MQRCRVRRQRHPDSEGEMMARMLGVRLPSLQPEPAEVRPEIWDKYRHLYPEDWVIEKQWIVCPDRKHPQGVSIRDPETNKREEWSGPATQYDSGLNMPRKCPPTGGSPPPVRLMTDDQLEERAKCYAENQAESNTENYAVYGYFTKEEAYKDKRPRCWGVVKISTPQQKFKYDVQHAKIQDERGLKLSDNEIRFAPPETGYLGLFTGGAAPESEKQSYHRGLVVKITGDYDPEIGYGGEDLHNMWGVITEIIDPWHFKIVPEGRDKEVIVRDTDVKGWIGDDTKDYVGIGKERWRQEVVPLIEETLRRF